MLVAVLADVHANLAAIEAVAGAIRRLRPDRVVCLGDLVGYHAEPAECVEQIRELADATVLGNHDHAVVSGTGLAGTSGLAQAICEWTRTRLDRAQLHFLGGLPRIVTDELFVAAHGCYLNGDHYYGYVTGTMLEQNLEAIGASAGWPKLAFCGHTHVPMCGWQAGGSAVEASLVAGARLQLPRRGATVLINPGSVGQPRDGDPRAAFALVECEQRWVELHREPYAIERTVASIRRAGLPPAIAERLVQGR